MDYQEAIEEAEIQIDMYESMILYNKDFEPKNDNSNYERKLDFLKTAISAMQELQEYHKTGLCPKQVTETICELGATKRVLEHFQQIGTLEEVREAVEKQKAKKPIIQQWSPARCPACGEELSESLGDGYYRHRTFLERCTNVECAQRLDWSEEE